MVSKSERRSTRIRKLLGMSHGKAANRLRKLLLFNQLKKHDENICVRCGAPILTPQELSIEHIKPWEGQSAELFWDLENIFFSHSACNKAAAKRTPRKVGKIGKSWCYRHKRFLPVHMFSKGRRYNGLQPQCKSCAKDLRTVGRVA